MIRIWIATLIATLALGTGCVYVDADPADNGGSGGGSTSTDGNSPPNVILEAVGGPFRAGEPVLVDASKTSDVDQDLLTYEWEVVDASGRDVLFGRAESGRAIEFTATDDAPFEITVTVDDGINEPVQRSLTVSTNNNPPSVSVSTCSQFDDLVRYERSGDFLSLELGTPQSVCLDASTSSDPEDHALSYQWVVSTTPTGIANTVVDGADIQIDVDQTGTWTGFLEVTDEYGATSSIDWTIYVR